MEDFDLYGLAFTLIHNNMSHSSKYNADILQKILKEIFKLGIYLFIKSVASDTTNSGIAVTRFLPPKAAQVNCEMHQLKLCMKYVFVIL